MLQRLLYNSVEGCIIVEAEIACVDDIVCASLFGKLVERSQISYLTNVSFECKKGVQTAVVQVPRTSAMQRTRIGPFWMTRPWFGRRGAAPG